MPAPRMRYGTERYQVGVPEEGMPGVRMPSGTSAEAFGVARAVGMGALAGGINKLAGVAIQRQEEYDRLRAEDANNQFTQQLLDLVHNPETGMINARRGEQAIMDNSVSRDFGNQSSKIKENISNNMKLNSRQQNLFDHIAINTALPFYKQVQGHESREYEAYKTGQFNSKINTLNQTIMAAPEDEDIWKNQIAQLYGYGAEEYKYMSHKMFDTTMKGLVSGLAQQRFSAISENDPIKAYDMAQASEDILPDAKAGFLSKLKVGAERRQSLLEGTNFYSKYGRDEDSAWNAIQSRDYTPEQMERVWQSYSNNVSRDRNIEAGMNNDRVRSIGNDIDSTISESMRSGVPIDERKVDEWATNDSTTTAQMNRALKWNRSFTDRSAATARVSANNSSTWNDLTLDQKDNLLIQDAFRAFDRPLSSRQNVIGALQSMVLSQDSEAKQEVMNAWNDRYITTNERDSYLTQITKIPKDQAQYYKNQEQYLKADIKNVFPELEIGKTYANEYGARAITKFKNDVSGLSYGPDYPEKIIAARRNALLTTTAEMNKELGTVKSLSGVADDIVKNITLQSYPINKPVFYRSAIDLGKLRTGYANRPSITMYDIPDRSHGDDFVNDITPAVMELSRKTNILPSIIMGQIMQETGIGRYRPNTYNIWGAKPGRSWEGNVTYNWTSEERGGKMVKEYAAFRDFKTWRDSFESQTKIYNQHNYDHIRGETDWQKAAVALGRSGYATESNYGRQVANHIRQHRLYELDDEFLNPTIENLEIAAYVDTHPGEIAERYAQTATASYPGGGAIQYAPETHPDINLGMTIGDRIIPNTIQPENRPDRVSLDEITAKSMRGFTF